MDFSTAWIYGRSLTKSLNLTKANHSFGKFSPTDRVKIELPRDLYALGAEFVNPTPFVVNENILVTVNDIDNQSSIIDFTNIRFTKSAFRSAANEFTSDKLTNDLESLGENLSATPDQILKFSELVCEWGGGQRVWGNLNRHYSKEQLGAELEKRLKSAKEQ